MNELYLIGTVHLDPDGPERLKNLLEHIDPEAVAVEMHKPAARVIEKLDTEFGNKLNPKKREKLISNVKKAGYNAEFVEALLSVVGYEYLVPKHYCKQKDIPLDLIYKPPPYKVRIGLFVISSILKYLKYIPKRNINFCDSDEKLFKMSVQELRQLMDEAYSTEMLREDSRVEACNNFKRKLEEEQFPVAELQEALDYLMSSRERRKTDELISSDEYIEQQLRQLCQEHEKLAYVGGVAHTFSTYSFEEKNLYERMLDLEPVRLMLCDSNDIILHPEKYGI